MHPKCTFIIIKQEDYTLLTRIIKVKRHHLPLALPLISTESEVPINKKQKRISKHSSSWTWRLTLPVQGPFLTHYVDLLIQAKIKSWGFAVVVVVIILEKRYD